MKKVVLILAVFLAVVLLLASCEEKHTHTAGEWVTDKEPTCTEAGSRHQVCADCGETIKTEEIPAGHTGDWVINKEPTCTENGERVRTCSVCGISQRETLYSPGHQFSDWETIKEVTCEKGLRERTCAVCGKLETKILPADYTAHIWGEETCTVCGEHKASEGLQYEMVNGNEIAIWGYTGSDTAVYLPSSYAGYVVTTIRFEAFKNQTQITKIFIPESITDIEWDAFSGCTNIQSATMPTNAISAFPKSNLKSVVLNGGTSIGEWAFSGCTGLTSVTIPDSVTSIGNSAFFECTGLTSVTIGNSVTSIGGCAFFECTGLANIVFRGTSDQWNEVYLDPSWKTNVGSISVQCTDKAIIIP